MKYRHIRYVYNKNLSTFNNKEKLFLYIQTKIISKVLKSEIDFLKTNHITAHTKREIFQINDKQLWLVIFFQIISFTFDFKLTS